MRNNELITILQNENQRNSIKFQLLNQWIRLMNEGVDLGEYFTDNGIGSIAVYGVGDIGKLVIDRLRFEGCGSLIKYAIDNFNGGQYSDVPILKLSEVSQSVGIVLITPVLISDAIEDEIYINLGEQRTMTFEELLYELSRKHKVKSALWEV